LAKAFKRELMQQDTNDELAGVLVGRKIWIINLAMKIGIQKTE
jgi:hypothetical protein